MKAPLLFYESILASQFVINPILCFIAQVIKVPKMGDSISEGTVQSFVKSKCQQPIIRSAKRYEFITKYDNKDA